MARPKRRPARQLAMPSLAVIAAVLVPACALLGGRGAAQDLQPAAVLAAGMSARSEADRRGAAGRKGPLPGQTPRFVHRRRAGRMILPAIMGLAAGLLPIAPVSGKRAVTFEERFDAAFSSPRPAVRSALAGAKAPCCTGSPPGRTDQRGPQTARAASKSAEGAKPGAGKPEPDKAVYGPPAPGGQAAAPVQSRPWGPGELIAIASQTHPDVMSARARVRSAEAGVAASRAEFLPAPQGSFDLSGGMSSASIGVGVPIYAGGRLDGGLEHAKALRLAADAGVAEARQQLGFSVVEAFYQWAVAVRSEQVKQRELSRLQERRGLIQRRIAAGASALSDDELVVSRIRQTQGDLAGYRANAASALAILSQLTGGVLTGGQLDLASQVPFLPDCNLLVSHGVIGAPGVTKAERQVDAARAAERTTRGGLLPTVSARVAYTRTRYAPPDSAADRNDLRAYLSVSVAPGAGLGTLARARSAAADVDSAVETLGSLRRSLTARIEGQCAAREAAVALQGELGDARASTERVYESYSRLFVAGKRSWLDVINAAREVSSVDLALVQSEERVRAVTWTLLLLAGDAVPQAEPEK